MGAESYVGTGDIGWTSVGRRRCRLDVSWTPVSLVGDVAARNVGAEDLDEGTWTRGRGGGSGAAEGAAPAAVPDDADVGAVGVVVAVAAVVTHGGSGHFPEGRVGGGRDIGRRTSEWRTSVSSV